MTGPHYCVSSRAMLRIFRLALALFFAPTPLIAATTDWTAVQGGAVRLISAGGLNGDHYLVGLEFSLEPGWHTYWRYPGEAGIPPQITVDLSDNLASHEVLYPVPERYSDGFSNSIVYHDGIVLPLRVYPEDTGRPVRISVDLFFGICKEICVPGDAQLILDLDADAELDSVSAKLIDRDLAAVPGIAPEGTLELRTVALADDGQNLRIETASAGGGASDLFAAGPDGSYIGLPVLKETSSGSTIWSLSTKGLKTTAADTDLRLVLTDGGNALERLVPIQPGWID